MSCFRHEAFLKNAALPPTTYAPLELPLYDFPDGYPSVGGSLDRKELKALTAGLPLA